MNSLAWTLRSATVLEVQPARRLLTAKLLELSDAAFRAMRMSICRYDDMSYNVLLTLEHLMYVPRQREASGPAEVNALVRRPLPTLTEILRAACFSWA